MRRFHIAGLMLLLPALAACATEARSGSASSTASRSSDKLDPVNAFPQTNGPYRRP
jgi:hypothetical protein